LFKPRGHLAVIPLTQYKPDALQILLSAVGLFVETDNLVKKFKIIGLPRRFHIDHYETANEARLSRQLMGCHELEFFHRALCIYGDTPCETLEGQPYETDNDRCHPVLEIHVTAASNLTLLSLGLMGLRGLPSDLGLMHLFPALGTDGQCPQHTAAAFA
jgi:hypothetical protein